MAKKIINERQFRSLIHKMVNESLDALSGYNFESKDNSDDEVGKKSNNKKRLQVKKFFKQPGVNPAAYAYKLYQVNVTKGNDSNDMKNARSKFMKCLNNEKNSDGYEYSFDSAEINTLYSMITSNQLTENKKKKQIVRINESQFNNLVKKVVKESVKMVLKENQILQWTKDDFYEFVYNYLDAQNVHNGLLIDTPFGDLNYKFSDEKTTLYIWFDSEEECSKLNDYVDADDVYDISYYGNCAFIRLIND